jgi:D-3-phosphoglycerate dehydrogenase
MVATISSVLGQHHLNIAMMQNMSRKSWAYTLVDIDGLISDDIVSALSSVTGIVRVRVLKGLKD